MRLGRIEILLIILVICAAIFMAIQYIPTGPKVCAPVPLSAEVKSYIDAKLAASADNAANANVPAVLARVTDLEAKMGTLDRYAELRAGLDQSRQALSETSLNTRQAQVDVLTIMRNAELSRLRNDLAMMCAGITVRPNQGAGAAPAGVGQGNRALPPRNPPGDNPNGGQN